MSAWQLECASPTQAVGATRVRVSINAQQYGVAGVAVGAGVAVASSGAAYTYEGAWSVHRIGSPMSY